MIAFFKRCSPLCCIISPSRFTRMSSIVMLILLPSQHKMIVSINDEPSSILFCINTNAFTREMWKYVTTRVQVICRPILHVRDITLGLINARLKWITLAHISVKTKPRFGIFTKYCTTESFMILYLVTFPKRCINYV